MTATTLPPALLVVIHAEGFAFGLLDRPFDSTALETAAHKVIYQRGQDWAESVLSRPLIERDHYRPHWPALRAGEPTILIEAHGMETALARRSQREIR